jgi:glycosyltransferase involved in cell wall biosynthesis
VIIPVYNCEHYIADAIESVLNQSYQPIEIIVVDDGSTDRSAEEVKQFPEVRYFYQTNEGIGAAINTGVDLATGKFFAFNGADDLWVEDKLTLQIAAFDSDNSLDIVFGHVQQFISPELPEGVKNRIKCPSDKMPGRIQGAMLVRREAFCRVGYFSLAIGEVLDWNLRARELGLKSKMLSEVVLKRRLHTTNSVILNPNYRIDCVRYLKASLDRRRKVKASVNED